VLLGIDRVSQYNTHAWQHLMGSKQRSDFRDPSVLLRNILSWYPIELLASFSTSKVIVRHDAKEQLDPPPSSLARQACSRFWDHQTTSKSQWIAALPREKTCWNGRLE